MNEETKSNSSSTILLLLIICILEVMSHWMSGSEKLDSNNVFFRFDLVRTLGPVLMFFYCFTCLLLVYFRPQGFKKELTLSNTRNKYSDRVTSDFLFGGPGRCGVIL